MKQSKIILSSVLTLVLFWVAAAAGQGLAYYKGKITEISKATQLGLGEKGTFFTIRIDTKPKMDFRLSREDAVKYGLIEAGGGSEVLTPKQMKGLGWNVRITVEKESRGLQGNPVYHVKDVERMSD